MYGQNSFNRPAINTMGLYPRRKPIECYRTPTPPPSIQSVMAEHPRDMLSPGPFPELGPEPEPIVEIEPELVRETEPQPQPEPQPEPQLRRMRRQRSSDPTIMRNNYFS